MDSDLEEGEIKDDGEEVRLSLENHRRRRESPPPKLVGKEKNGTDVEIGSHGRNARKNSRLLGVQSRSRPSLANGRLNANRQMSPRVPNTMMRGRRPRKDGTNKKLGKLGKRRVEAVQDSRSHASKSIVISVENIKRSTKSSETKENNTTYGQVSNSVNQPSKSWNEKRGNLHLTEVERNEMISSLKNLTRRNSTSAKNGMSDISDTSDDDRSIVSIEPPPKPEPELIVIDDSPDSEGEDVEALQLRKQIIQDLMSKYENAKAVDLVVNTRGRTTRNDDEEPYSPVDEDIGRKSSNSQTSDMIASWLEQAKHASSEYQSVSVSAPIVFPDASKRNNSIVQSETITQYPHLTTLNVTQAENTFSPAISSSTSVYSNNLFLPQIGCGDVDMRLLNYQATSALSATHLPIQYTSVMAPELFKPNQGGSNPSMNNFLAPSCNVSSLISDNFGRSFSQPNFTTAMHREGMQFSSVGQSFVDNPLNYNTSSSMRMDSAIPWNHFATTVSSENNLIAPGFRGIPPPLPDSAPPVPPPPPPLESLPATVQVQNSSLAGISEPRVPSPPTETLFPGPIQTTVNVEQAEPQILTQMLLAESKDIDDRAKAYAETFEILNVKNTASVSGEEIVKPYQISSSNMYPETKRRRESATTRHRSSSPDTRTRGRASRSKHRSTERKNDKSSHRRESLDHHRRRSRSKSRRRESYKPAKTDLQYFERRKRRNSSPSPVRRSKINRTDSNASSSRRHSSSEPLSPVSSSTNTAEKSSAVAVLTEKEVLRPKIVEKSFDGMGSGIIISVNNENATITPPCEPTSTVNIIEPAVTISQEAPDLQAYAVDDEEILRAQLLLDMARKKNNTIPSPVPVSFTPPQLPAMTLTENSVFPEANQPLPVVIAKTNLPKSSPPLSFVKDNRPTILKSVSNPRSKNRQIVRVANVAPNSVPNFRLQKTIVNNAKNPPIRSSLHSIQRTVINTNLLKKNLYNKNADPVMRHLKITVPNKAVTPLIIPARRDETSSEDEANDTENNKRSTTSPKKVVPKPKSHPGDASQVLPAGFEMSLDNLLRTSRQQTNKSSNTSASSEAVKHLPPDKQEEYMRLKLQLETYERKIQKKERAKQEQNKGPGLAMVEKPLKAATKSVLHDSNRSLDVVGVLGGLRMGNQVRTVDGQKSKEDNQSIPHNVVEKVVGSKPELIAQAKSNFSLLSAAPLGHGATSAISEAVSVPLVVRDKQLTDTRIEKREESESVSSKSPIYQSKSKEDINEENERTLLGDDGGIVEYLSAENEDRLLASDDEIVHGASADAEMKGRSPQETSDNDIGNDASIGSASESASYNHSSRLDEILNTESVDASPDDTVEVRSPQAHVIDVSKQREEFLLRERLLKAALLKKMEASNDRITLRKLEREVISSRRSINRELTSLLSEMVKMSDLKVVSKSREDKVISLREQLYAAEQQLNHTLSQIQARETRRNALNTRVIDMRKCCFGLVKNCRAQGLKIDKNYKVPSREYLEMRSKLMEVRNQNLVFRREARKQKMSPRKSFLEQQGPFKGYRKTMHMSATLAAASRVKKSFNTCLKGKKRVGLSSSIYDPVKSKFNLPITHQQLKSPVRRPQFYRHPKKMKNLTSVASPMLLTKHGRTAQDTFDGESVFLLPKMRFQDVLTQDEVPPVKYKFIPIVPYCVYQSPLESIRKQKKQLSDSNTTPGLIKNIDPFVTLCHFELRGMCNSNKCAFQHLYRPQRKVTMTK